MIAGIGAPSEEAAPAPLRKRNRAVETDDDLLLLDGLPVKQYAPMDLINSRRRKVSYSVAEKRAVLEVYAAVGTKNKAVRIVRRKPGYEKISATNLRHWEISITPRKPTGRPVNHDFERHVMSLLPNPSKAELQKVAIAARLKDPWNTDEKLQGLKFSDPWAEGVLKRAVASSADASLAVLTSIDDESSNS